MASPTISIVIPFYNISECVGYCLRSVLAQDYDDYEVICVDDGSSDGTGALLDEFARKDFRIHVVHKTNGGLSDARNVGVSESSGRYISFVDGDDIVSPYYLSSLMHCMPSCKKSMAIGVPVSIRQDDVLCKKVSWQKPQCYRDATQQQICSEILTKRIGTVAWAKLASRSLYERNAFPIGVRYEELRTIANFVSEVDAFGVVEEPIYGYVMRKGSIVWATNPSAKQANEYLEAINTSSEHLGKLCPDGYDELCFYRAVMFTRLHDFIARGLDSPLEQRRIEHIAKNAVKKNMPNALKAKGASRAQKSRIALYAMAGKSYDLLMHIYNKYSKGL